MTTNSLPPDPSELKSANSEAKERQSRDDENRSDLNDGVERPLGYYSSQAQADRNAGRPGATPTNKAAGGPGFYSPEQQMARNTPRGAVSPTPFEPGEQTAPVVGNDVDKASSKRSAVDDNEEG